MAQPGDQLTKYIQRTTAAGVAVTGKVTADFTFRNSYRPNGGAVTTWASGDAIVEIGGGWYSWTFAAPPNAGQWFNAIFVASGTDIVNPYMFSGETEVEDLDAIFAATSRPIATLSASSLIFAQQPINLIANRYWLMTWSIVDANGGASDLSGYTNWKLRVFSDDQTTTQWIGSNNAPTGFKISAAAGVITVEWPESAFGPKYLVWAASKPRVLGDYLRPSTNNGFIYECTTAGTGAAGEPAWTTTVGTTVADGTVVWTCREKSIWIGSAARVLDEVVTPTTQLNPGVCFRCIVAGTSAAPGSEPAWPTTAGTTIVDGTVTWQCQTDLYAALAAGLASVNLNYEITADKVGKTNQTVAIIPSSPLTLKRREGAN